MKFTNFNYFNFKKINLKNKKHLDGNKSSLLLSLLFLSPLLSPLLSWFRLSLRLINRSLYSFTVPLFIHPCKSHLLVGITDPRFCRRLLRGNLFGWPVHTIHSFIGDLFSGKSIKIVLGIIIDISLFGFSFSWEED